MQKNQQPQPATLTSDFLRKLIEYMSNEPTTQPVKVVAEFIAIISTALQQQPQQPDQPKE